MAGAGLSAEEVMPLHAQIDGLMTKDWAAAKITPAALSTDAEFFRRLNLDLNGVIPTPTETREFLDGQQADRRPRAIDALLSRPEYALHMARVFDVILAERRLPAVKSYDVAGTAWRGYLAESFAANKPWDVIVREILASDGSDESQAAAVKFYIARDAEPHQLTRDVARVFLGTDLQCAQCHDDPRFDDYKQADYFGIYAFVSRLSFFRDNKLNRSFVGEKAVGDVTFTSVFAANQGKTDPRLPGGKMIADPIMEKGKEYVMAPSATARGVPVYSRRKQLAAQMPRAETPGFSRNLGNRLWALMFGRGLVHPLDLHHAKNPPSHPAVLAAIEQWLVLHHYDIKGCLREIALTRCYQMSGELPGGAEPPVDAFAVAAMRALTPEQMRWSLLQATGRIEANFLRTLEQLKKTKPAEVEAKLKDWSWRKDGYELLEKQSSAVIAAFSPLPGTDDSKVDPVVDHTLFLLNSPKIMELVKASPGTPFDRWAAMSDPVALAEDVYLSIFNRRPIAEETEEIARLMTSAKTPKARAEALQPLVWGLLLSAEFRFNH
ncbi:DUF1549 domain-containing protein [Prosthecobacter sp.]|uniref:DUF1549 domain-containing protein n=1 Tax=Prosthecobacter sp. TaxID=1965333 RepID=UPI0025DCDEC9|nr:DUF1549 domain-containing protein [Prosthecobacter sp.]